MNTPIIEQPALQSGAQKLIYGILTLLAWFVWFYITWPFLGIVSNILGVKLLGQQQFDAATAAIAQQILMVAWWCAVVAVLCAVFFAGWIIYHRLRFGDGTRRQQALLSQPNTVSSTFGVSAATMSELQMARRIVLHHTDRGALERIDTGGAPGDEPLKHAA